MIPLSFVVPPYGLPLGGSGGQSSSWSPCLLPLLGVMKRFRGSFSALDRSPLVSGTLPFASFREQPCLLVLLCCCACNHLCETEPSTSLGHFHDAAPFRAPGSVLLGCRVPVLSEPACPPLLKTSSGCEMPPKSCRRRREGLSAGTLVREGPRGGIMLELRLSEYWHCDCWDKGQGQG